MSYYIKRLFLLGLIITASACIPGLYYLGFHGPSIKLTPDDHEGYTEDEECRDCHGEDSDPDEAPRSTHYNFHGCLKCHDDEVNPVDVKQKPDPNSKNS